MTDSKLFSISEIARELGADRKTVSARLEAAGIAAQGRRRGYDVYGLASIVQAMGDRMRSVSTDDPGTMRPFERRAYWQAETERLRYEEAAGNLLPVDRVHVLVSEIYGPMIRALDGLGDRVERDLRVSPTVVEYIRDEVGKARNQMEAGLRALLDQ